MAPASNAKLHKASSVEFPRLTLEYFDVRALKPNPQNPRIHSLNQRRKLGRSIKQFGMIIPILIDKHANIIAGHCRRDVCEEEGIPEVPTICIDHLTDSQLRAFMIADNRLAEISEWDPRLLGEQLKILSEAELDFNLDVIGFETAEIDLHIQGLEEDSEEDEADRIPDMSLEEPVSKFGDMWCLDKHRVLCGNALTAADYEILMNRKKAHLAFTDPPYNVKVNGHVVTRANKRHREFPMATGEMTDQEFEHFLTQALRNLATNALEGSIHFVCMDWRHMTQLHAAGRQVFSALENICVWAKTVGGMGSFYRSQHELVFVFKAGKGPHRNNIELGKHGRYRTNLWNYPSAHSFDRASSEKDLSALHPTVKPVALVADAIMDCSARGDIVLDPFLGSGTTVIAAQRTGRICYGMELDPRYVDTIVRRWQNFTGQAAVNMNGETFRSRGECSRG
jgi:DNA modification methylase